VPFFLGGDFEPVTFYELADGCFLCFRQINEGALIKLRFRLP